MTLPYCRLRFKRDRKGERKDVPQWLKRLRKKSMLGQKSVPQGLKPGILSIVYGPTKVVP